MRNALNPVINMDEKFPHKIDLFVQVYETIIDKVGDHVPPHKWSYYRLGLLKEGSADYTCGIYKFKAKENTLLIMPPRIVTASTNWTVDVQGYFLAFNHDFFLQSHFPHKYLANKKILQPSVKPYMHLPVELAGKAEQIFKTILKEKYENKSHRKELIAIKIVELLILVERLYLEVHEFDDNQITLDLVKRFSDLIEVNFARERSVAFYASALHVHPNHLNAVIKRHSGMTAKDSIQNRLLLETKYLLHQTTLSVKEIAHQLGFDDPNYFAVFFKRSEGLSPIAYRASIL